MTGVAPPTERPDPLRESSRYDKIADLSSGSFGFVQLARNTETNELVAIKFIERGDRWVGGPAHGEAGPRPVGRQAWCVSLGGGWDRTGWDRMGGMGLNRGGACNLRELDGRGKQQLPG
jgi:hypothetical protein